MKFQNALLDSKVKAAKKEAKPYKLADGEGLYILVHPNGSKYWRFNYRNAEGAWKTLSFGVYPDVTIKEARLKHQEAASKVKAGEDPAAERRAVKEVLADRATFREVSAEWLRVMMPEDKFAAKTVASATRMVGYCNAAFGDKVCADLTVRDLANLLVEFETDGKYETRMRIQGAARAVAGFAVGRGIIAANPFSEIKYAEAFTAPEQSPRPALTEASPFGELLRKIDLYDARYGTNLIPAFQLLALTFVRPGELTSAKWSHVDIDDERKWSIPPDALKMRTKRRKAKSGRSGKSHDVPLSRQAISLLRRLRDITGDGEYLFPGIQGATTLSVTGINRVLTRMGYQGIHCAHGFRSTASTLLNAERIVIDDRKHLVWPDQKALIEVQLDHEDDSTRAIYDRGGKWEERVELMQHWADMIDVMRSGAPAKKRLPLRVVAA